MTAALSTAPMAKRTIRSPGMPAAQSAAALRLLYANHQGSIVSTVDTAGNATWLFRFDDYGITEAQGDVALTPANGVRFG